MEFRAPAIICASRAHGEAGAIVRLIARDHGLVSTYVAGARGRVLRPVLIPGNLVDASVRSRTEAQLPWARVELLDSRGALLGEPLPAAAIAWVTTLAAMALPERHPYPPVYEALHGVLGAIAFAPSARGWVGPLMSYEALVMRELGYGESADAAVDDDWAATLARFDAIGRRLARYPLAEGRGDGMAARALLRDRLGRIGG